MLMLKKNIKHENFIKLTQSANGNFGEFQILHIRAQQVYLSITFYLNSLDSVITAIFVIVYCNAAKRFQQGTVHELRDTF